MCKIRIFRADTNNMAVEEISSEKPTRGRVSEILLRHVLALSFPIYLSLSHYIFVTSSKRPSIFLSSKNNSDDVTTRLMRRHYKRITEHFQLCTFSFSLSLSLSLLHLLSFLSFQDKRLRIIFALPKFWSQFSWLYAAL